MHIVIGNVMVITNARGGFSSVGNTTSRHRHARRRPTIDIMIPNESLSRSWMITIIY